MLCEIFLAVLVVEAAIALILLKEIEENIEDVVHVILYGKSRKFKELNP